MRIPVRIPLPRQALTVVERRLAARRAVVPMLRAAQPPLRPARSPVIDAHAHLNSVFAGRWRRRSLEQVLAAMDGAGIVGLVDLDGGQGERLSREIDRLQRPAPERIAVFAGIDPDGFSLRDAFGEYEAAQLRDSVARGARGLKVWKSLGLHARDRAGRTIGIDDSRLDPLWQAAAELHVPILIHVADPPAFFEPLNARNERAAELRHHPEWHFQPVRRTPDGRGYPSHAELIEQFDRVLARHPETIFIGAHLASSGDDLERLATMLRGHANLYVDIAARLNELGRQPYTARDFFVDFADRVLLGTDTGPDPRWYPIYFRFLETSSEYMNYSIFDPPGQGDWRVHGLALPDDVLEKVYHANAARLIRFGA